jgi:hypothetical protein
VELIYAGQTGYRGRIARKYYARRGSVEQAHMDIKVLA